MMTKHDVFELANRPPNVAHAIDNLRISESDRQLARQYLRNGELMADLICRASENLRSAAALVISSFRARQVSKTKG